MVQKIRFKAIDFRGKVFCFNENVECPDFSIIPSKKWKGINLPETSIESQIIDWFDEQGKKRIMDSKDIAIIIDYWIPKKKEKQPTLLDVFKAINTSEKTTLDAMAVYQEIKDLLKGKSVTEKVRLIFSHMNVGYTASGVAYERMTQILKDGSATLCKESLLSAPSTTSELVQIT